MRVETWMFISMIGIFACAALMVTKLIQLSDSVARIQKLLENRK